MLVILFYSNRFIFFGYFIKFSKFTKMSGVDLDEIIGASGSFTAFSNPSKDKIKLKCLPGHQIDKTELGNVYGEHVKVKSSKNNTEKKMISTNLPGRFIYKNNFWKG